MDLRPVFCYSFHAMSFLHEWICYPLCACKITKEFLHPWRISLGSLWPARVPYAFLFPYLSTHKQMATFSYWIQHHHVWSTVYTEQSLIMPLARFLSARKTNGGVRSRFIAASNTVASFMPERLDTVTKPSYSIIYYSKTRKKVKAVFKNPTILTAWQYRSQGGKKIKY